MNPKDSGDLYWRAEANRNELNPINNNTAAYTDDVEDAGDSNQNEFDGADEDYGKFSLAKIYPPLFLHSHLYLLFPQPLYQALVIYQMSLIYLMAALTYSVIHHMGDVLYPKIDHMGK